MNDLDLVRSMRADTASPSRQRLDAGQERLLAAIESSPSRAVRRERRLRGVRRMLLAGAATALAAAVAVATQVDVHPASVNVRPTTLHPLPAADANYTDVLVGRAAFGWLPDGLHANGYVADRQDQDFFQVTAMEPGTRAGVSLTDYGRGKEPILPYLSGGVPGKRIPAPPVNGHYAYWTSAPDQNGQSTFELRWQYATDSWAELVGNGLQGSSTELTTMAYKIAESVRFGAPRPIAMPLHVDGVPGGLTPQRTVLNNGAFGQVTADLAFLEPGTSILEIRVTESDGTVGTGVPDERGPSSDSPVPTRS